MHHPLSVKPVRRCRTPKYPTKEQVLSDPELLYAVPIRWRTRPLLCSVLVFTIAGGLYGCAPNREEEQPQSALEEPVAPLPKDETQSAGESTPEPVREEPASQAPREAMQIPVFAHGSGRGSYGCESVAPPVFLSEEEAAQVIREEAILQGVDFSAQKTIDANIPVTNLYGDEQFSGKSVQGPLTLDGYDEALGVGFEFVSQKDVSAWSQAGGRMSSVEEYRMKNAAERLASAVPDTAVFYDPGADWSAFSFDWQNGSQADYEAYVRQYTEQQKESMEEQRREQVRDFLAWLAGQGVI